jgi:stearoyl-CoA desaturase (delta-9 desaturase)
LRPTNFRAQEVNHLQNIIAFPDRTTLRWENIIPVVIFHAATIVALFYFSWTNLFVALALNWVAGSLGIGLGFHRLLTHKSYKTPKWLEYILTTLGTLGLQGSPIAWVTTHRIHHKFTETEKDPHSPNNGTYWSHIGWILRGTSQTYDEGTVQKFVPDMLKDRFHVLISKYFYVPITLSGILLWAIFGWQVMLWGVFVRVVIGWHTTWLVNSATHIWGSRRFDTTDTSTNNFWIAMMTWGEGWHNNHHAYPTSARHGLTWKEFDLNWLQIKLLEKLGLAHSVREFSFEKEKTVLRNAA